MRTELDVKAKKDKMGKREEKKEMADGSNNFQHKLVFSALCNPNSSPMARILVDT